MTLAYGALARFLSPEGTDGNGTGAGVTPAPTVLPSGGRDDGDDDLDEHDAAKLMDALRKERQARRDAARERNELLKWRQDQEKAAADAATKEAAELGEWRTVAEAHEARARAAEAELAAEREARRRDSVTSAIRFAAQELGFHDAEDAIGRIELSQVTFGDDGRPKNVASLVKKLADDKPYLIAGALQGGNAAIPRTPNASTITREQFLAQEKERALASGKYSRL